MTIPKEIRDEFGLVKGTVVKIRSRDGIIEIEPPVKLSRLVGLVKTEKPSDDPKSEARAYMKSMLDKEVGWSRV